MPWHTRIKRAALLDAFAAEEDDAALVQRARDWLAELDVSLAKIDALNQLAANKRNAEASIAAVRSYCASAGVTDRCIKQIRELLEE